MREHQAHDQHRHREDQQRPGRAAAVFARGRRGRPVSRPRAARGRCEWLLLKIAQRIAAMLCHLSSSQGRAGEGCDATVTRGPEASPSGPAPISAGARHPTRAAEALLRLALECSDTVSLGRFRPTAPLCSGLARRPLKAVARVRIPSGLPDEGAPDQWRHRSGALSRLGRDRQPPSEPTARAITSSDVSRAAVAWMPINILARVESGIVSVGLNALELVSETYR